VCHRRAVPYKERWTNSTKSLFEPVAYWDSNRVLLVHIPSVLLLHHPQTVTEIIRHLYSPTTCAKGGENLRTGKLKLRYAHRVLHFRHYVWHIHNVPYTHYMGTNKTAVTWTAQIKITCSGSSISTDQKLSLRCLGAEAKRWSKLCTLCVLQQWMNHKRPRNSTLRVTSSSSSTYTTRCLDTGLCCQYVGVEVTRNTAVIPTTVFFTNRFRGSISFLSKQYASIIAPAAGYSLSKPGNYSLLSWCNECTDTTAMAVLSRTKNFRFGQH
jgi:hypothetical protein